MRFVLLFLVGWMIGAAELCAQDLERRHERTFAAPPETVLLNVTRGVVEVTSVAADADLRFDVTLRVQRKDVDAGARGLLDRLAPDLLAPLKRDIEGAFASLEPRFRADGRRVELTVRDRREVVFDSDPTLQMIIDVKVAVPAGRRLEVRTVAAGVMIEDFPGSVEIRGETGSYFVKSVGGDFTATTTSGGITVSEVGGRATLRTASGNILAGRLRGPARLATANGAVEVQQAVGPLKIRGADADIVVGLARPLPKEIDIETSAGSIVMNVDQDVPLTVDATTRLLGKVRTRGLEPVVRRGAFNESALLADFNGGGEAVRLRTSWGNILLVGREPLDG